MSTVRAVLVGCLLAAGCGVRAPAPVDVAALVSTRGAVEARRELTVRVLADPRDVQARLALATLAEQTGRPSEAIDQLDAVERLGGPLGARWHDADRARLGRLLRARGRVRLARGAPTAFADLDRASTFGAAASNEELARARLVIAIAQLRHSDADERAKGRASIAALPRDGVTTLPNDIAGGAKPGAAPALRGHFGAWAWSQGARREAYDQLAAWHAATKPPRDEALQGAYLRALAWWSPVWLGEAKLPPAEDLVGPGRCWYPGADCLPPAPDEPVLPAVPALDAEPRVIAAVHYAATRFVGSADASALAPIARAFGRDPTIAERLGRDLVASATDAAAAHATLGALFAALGDPARSRAAWHEAVVASPEPMFVRGLAEAAARAGDGAAALVFATQAAAAWGDPAVVWAAVARVLVDAGQSVEALTAARNAIDLAGPEVLPRAFDVAVDASRALGRTGQASALAAQRTRVADKTRTDDPDVRAALLAHEEQPTATTVARLWVVSRERPRDVELRAALRAALAADDPRRAAIESELLALAGHPDPARAFAAVAALQR